jgi:3-dehydroquinate synthase
MQQYHQNFRVPFDYPVLFSRGIFDPSNRSITNALDRLQEQRVHRVIVFVDDGITARHPDLLRRIESYFLEHRKTMELVCAPVSVPGGEAFKNDYRQLMHAVDAMLEHQMCRHSFVLVIGGGAVLDAIGFGASIVHRGLRVVRVPTTVLAQCDAGIGVKNGMNLHGGKNTVGTFYPPFAVINDADFLATLPDPHWRGGVAEAFKVAMIKDADFFEDLCSWANAVRSRDGGVMEKIIHRCAALHLDHIRNSGDPFENGNARPLDFGHWIAHKLESMTSYKLSHGEAVSIGIAVDAIYAADKGWLSGLDADRLVHSLQVCDLPTWHDALGHTVAGGRLEILGGLDDFREHLGGELCVTYPGPLGAKREMHEVDAAGVLSACMKLKEARAHA